MVKRVDGRIMEKQKLYTVTKPSSDGTFYAGDVIWISKNGNMNNANVNGWLSKDEWDVSGINDFEVEECKTHHLLVSGDEEMVVKNECLI